VATTAGGIPEVVVHGREGFLVEPGDPAGLADAAATLVDDLDLRHRMGRAASVRGAHFGIEPAVRRIQELYDEVLG
jgi:glycosyltransferase involved in cell wall biosynthesis